MLFVLSPCLTDATTMGEILDHLHFERIIDIIWANMKQWYTRDLFNIMAIASNHMIIIHITRLDEYETERDRRLF